MIKFGFVRLTAVFAGASLLLNTVTARANTIGLYQGAYSYDVGGEFTAITSPASFVNYYSPLAQYTVNVNGANVTGFQTFCVQVDVDFYPGTIYNYSVSLASIGNPGNVDAYPLSEGAAFLYSKFAQGILTGYDYLDTATSGNGLGRKVDAGLLQAAIWALQGGQSYGDGQYASLASTEANNPFYLLAQSTLGANLETAATPTTDFGVEILNISSANGNSDQNQLVYTGVPDGGKTLALLALGLAGLSAVSLWIRRNSAALVAVRARN
jgi:hypothetical protein